jgi:hypothetical protein
MHLSLFSAPARRFKEKSVVACDREKSIPGVDILYNRSKGFHKEWSTRETQPGSCRGNLGCFLY